jgi:hypothetical protein
MKRLKRIAYGAYLGGSVGFFLGGSWNDWRWFVIIIPTLLLAEWGFNSENED